MLIRALLVSSLSFPCSVYAGHVTIPAGSFPMGCSTGDPVCDRDEGSEGGTTVEVPSFRIDRYEVRVDEFRACVRAGVCQAPPTTMACSTCTAMWASGPQTGTPRMPLSLTMLGAISAGRPRAGSGWCGAVPGTRTRITSGTRSGTPSRAHRQGDGIYGSIGFRCAYGAE